MVINHSLDIYSDSGLTMIPVIFWTSVSLIIWSYCIYPIYLWIKLLRVKLKSNDASDQGKVPSVSILIAAYNEEKCIADKIQNCLDLDYPVGRLEIIVASDGSSDKTLDILQRFESRKSFQLVDLPRGGKAKAINAMFKLTHGEILVLTDANVFLANDAMKKVVVMFNDPEVGCVTTMKRLRSEGNKGEGLYWKYEYFIKKHESMVSSAAGADGGFYAIRRELFRPLYEHKNIADDLALSVTVWLFGKKIRVAESVFSFEDATTSISEEYRRKSRIAEGSFRVLFQNKWLLSPWLNSYAIEFISHKVLRWLGPYLMLLAFICSALLYESILYRVFFFMSIIFTLAGIVGLVKIIKLTPFVFIGHFILANAAQVQGLYNLIFKPKPAYWKPRSG